MHPAWIRAILQERRRIQKTFVFAYMQRTILTIIVLGKLVATGSNMLAPLLLILTGQKGEILTFGAWAESVFMRRVNLAHVSCSNNLRRQLFAGQLGLAGMCIRQKRRAPMLVFESEICCQIWFVVEALFKNFHRIECPDTATWDAQLAQLYEFASCMITYLEVEALLSTPWTTRHPASLA